MKTSYRMVLVLIIAATILLTAPLPCWAVEKGEENIWREDEAKGKHRRFELTDEVIEHMMERLKETNPERAEELAKLQDKEPEQFKAELRKVMREQFGKRPIEQREQRAGRKFRTAEGMPPFIGPGGPAGGHGEPPSGGRRKEMIREHLRERDAEYLEWLGQNYPEEAEKLAELREAKPELHMRRLWLSKRKYGRIWEASKENPELAEVLKKDLELKNRRDKLLKEIRVASDDEKKELIKELEEVISNRFDLLVRRKQIMYERLRKELEELKERVKQSEAEVEKWKDVKFKNENVKTRVEELVGGTEKFRWE